MDFEKFESRLKSRLCETEIEAKTDIGSAFNAGLNTMMNIAITEFIKMNTEKDHE